MSRPDFYPNAYAWLLIPFVITIAGFTPSYFMRLTETGAAHHFHAITGTLWMLLLVTQPLLYRLDKMRLHRLAGRFSLVLVPLIVIGGLIMVHYMLNNPRYPTGLAQRLAFIDFTILIQFTLFYVLALKYVHDTQYHARLMVCTVFGPFLPGVARLLPIVPGIGSLSAALDYAYLLAEIALIVLIIDDYRKGHIRWPYPFALALLVISHITMHFAYEWDWWLWLMSWFASIG